MGRKAGAPKSKAKAAPKGLAKRVLKGQPCEQAASDVHGAKDGGTARLVEVVTKSLKPTRSAAVESKLSRIYRTKLKHWHAEERKAAVSKTDKISVDDFLEAGILKLTGSKKLSGKFWVEFYEEYELSSNMFAGITVEPPPGEEADEDLVEACLEVRDANPVARKTTAFMDWIQYKPVQGLKLADLILMLEASRSDARVSANHSYEMQVAIVKFLGKSGVKEKWPHLWAEIENDVDMILTRLWEKALQAGLKRPTFIHTNKVALQLLLDMEAVKSVEAALDAKTTVPVPTLLLKQLMSTGIGASLYKESGRHVSFHEFIESVEKGIYDLEMVNFDLEETGKFKDIMLNQAKLFTKQGIAQILKKEPPTILKLFKWPLPSKLETLNAHWNFRHECKIRELAVHRNLVERTAWEKIAFGADAPIHGLNDTVQILEELLHGTMCARQVIAELLQPYGSDLTFCDMKRIVLAGADSIREVDDFADIEISFLEHSVENMVESDIRASALKLWPQPIPTTTDNFEQKKISAVRDGMWELLADPRIKFCDEKLGTDISTMHGLLKELDLGRSPVKQHVARWSKWMQHAWSLSERFLVTTQFSPVLFSPPKMLFGRDALAVLYAEYESAQRSEAVDVQLLKQFDWMMTPAQSHAVQGSVNSFVAAARQTMVAPQALKDGSVDGVKKGTSSKGEGGASSSSGGVSSTNGLAMVDMMAQSADKGQKRVIDVKRDADKDAQKQKLLRMLHKGTKQC